MSEVRAHLANRLSQNDWAELQAVARQACLQSFDATTGEIDAYIGWDEPERFAASHADPNTEVGRRLNDNQAYYFPRVFTLAEHGEVTGWLYTAHNTSGAEPRVRLKKELSVVKSHLWLREVYTLNQGQGDAEMLFYRSLRHVLSKHPLAAYLYPDLYKSDQVDLVQKLGEVGMYVDADVPGGGQPFGESGRRTRRVVMRGKVGTVRRNLREGARA